MERPTRGGDRLFPAKYIRFDLQKPRERRQGTLAFGYQDREAKGSTVGDTNLR